jgi:hypothetical protein
MGARERERERERESVRVRRHARRNAYRRGRIDKGTAHSSK